jgi:magnesium chelatase family protein
MQGILKKAFDRFGLSARGFYRMLRVARSIADLAAHPKITVPDVLEALQYRVIMG